MRLRLILGVALVALVAGGTIWFHNTFVKVPTRTWVGPSGEARLRPFLAAERFAERMGLGARELRALPELGTLPPGGVMILPARRQALDRPHLERILAWVQAGGHLIAEAEPRALPDPLFDLLGVRRVEAPYLPKPLLLELPRAERGLKIAQRTRMALEPPTSRLLLRLMSGDTLRLASYTRGRGAVTVVTSLDFARNPLVGEDDHAEALWRLMQLTPAKQLAVYWRPVRLSLWGFLVEHALAAVAASAVLLAMWLWRIAPRFGPVAPDAPPARRRLLDHLRASGRYYWGQGLRERLVIAARDAALRRVARAQPEFVVAPALERAARLAELAAIAPEDAARLLGAGGEMRGAAFIKVMQTAQRVHAALERGNR